MIACAASACNGLLDDNFVDASPITKRSASRAGSCGFGRAILVGFAGLLCTSILARCRGFCSPAYSLGLGRPRFQAPPKRPTQQRLARRYLRLRAQGGAGALPSDDFALPVAAARWLPPMDTDAEELQPSGAPGVTVLPVFPLGSAAYTPFSCHELNIFEPRYRKLYDDILFSGSRRFVVMASSPDGERFAEVGVVFYLTDLQDVSEMTSDEVKYVCQHRVIGRVKIERFLNPASWEEGDTYLRAETTPVEDTEIDKGLDLSAEEDEVMSTLQRLARLQLELEVAQISPDIAEHVNASRSEEGGLWRLIALWAEYHEYLFVEHEQQLDEDMTRVYNAHVEVAGGTPLGMEDLEEEDEFDEGMLDEDFDFDEAMLDEDEDEDDDGDEDEAEDYESGPRVYIDDLPLKVQADMRNLQDEFEEDVDVMAGEQNELMQLFLQSTSHGERLFLMGEALSAEERRLSTKLTLLATVRESIP